MKNLFIFFLLGASTLSFNSFTAENTNTNSEEQIISFYEVPLVCGAAPEIGCGSRLKPLFLDTEKQTQIKESWSNRQGTVIAIIWNDLMLTEKSREEIIQPIFKNHSIDAVLITDKSSVTELTSSFSKDKWYKGMEVDLLSIEEAGIIAESLTGFAKDKGLITEQEYIAIKKDFEEYFKAELTQSRTYENLVSESTQEKWREDGYQIYVKHIGKERADAISKLYNECQSGLINDEVENSGCSDKKGEKKDCCKKH